MADRGEVFVFDGQLVVVGPIVENVVRTQLADDVAYRVDLYPGVLPSGNGVLYFEIW